MFEVKKTPKIIAKLKAIVGDKVDLAKLKVYETRSNNTKPIDGAGGFYKNATMDKAYLQGMADIVLSGGYVPIIHHHETYGTHAEGRIFDAAVFDNEEGGSDLHTLLYFVDSPDNQKFSEKLDAGVINEVSTNSLPSALKCSQCNYDFLGGADNRRNLSAGKDYTPLCPNGHQWGVGDNHLVLSGAPRSWKEQSFVLRGAVTGAKVLNDKEQKLSLDSAPIALAAGDVDDTLSLNTRIEDFDKTFDSNGSNDLSNNANSGNKPMSEISIKLTDYNAGVVAQSKVSELESKLAAAETAKTTAESEKAAAEAKLAAAEADKTAAEAKLATAEADKTAVEAKLAILQAGGGGSQEGNDKGNAAITLGADDLPLSCFKANR